MFGDIKAEPVVVGSLLPFANHVSPGTHIDGVPPMELGIPEKEVVMMRAHADEVFGAGSLIESHQALRIPLLRLPQRDDVLLTVSGRIALTAQITFLLCVHFD